MKPIAHYVEETGISVGQLVAAAGLDAKLVKAIVSGNYTPSPSQRQRFGRRARRFDGRLSWGHAVPVEHLRGNGHNRALHLIRHLILFLRMDCGAAMAQTPPPTSMPGLKLGLE